MVGNVGSAVQRSRNIDERVNGRVNAGPEEVAMLSKLHPQELRDRYIQIKEDYFSLKKQTRQQTEEMRRMNTKMRKLESDLKRERRPASAPLSKDLQLEVSKDLTDIQEAAINQLSYRTESLERKLKMANIHMYAARNNMPVMYRDVRPRVDTWLRGPPRNRLFRTPPPSRSGTPNSTHISRRFRPRSLSPSPRTGSAMHSHGSLRKSESLEDIGISKQVQDILTEAKERIEYLESNRVSLEKYLSEANQRLDDNDNDHRQRQESLEAELKVLRDCLRECGAREEEEATDAILAGREVKSLKAQLAGIEERSKISEDMLQVERQRRKEFIKEIDELRTSLQAESDDKRTCQLESKRLSNDFEEFKIKYDVLSAQNRDLEVEKEKLVSLTERCVQDTRVPLASEASTISLRNKIVELEKSLQVELKEKNDLLKKLKESVEKENRSSDDLIASNQTIETLQRQLEDCQKDARTEQETLFMQRSGGKIFHDPVLVDRSTQSSFSEKNRSQESETSTNSSKLQTELYNLQSKYDARSKDLVDANKLLNQQLQAFEALSEKYNSLKRQYLENEKVWSEKIQNLQQTLNDQQNNSNSLCDELNVNDSIMVKEKGDPTSNSMKLSKKENIIEFCIEQAILDSAAYDNEKTFVSWMMPFSVDDPLQHTNLAIGSLANYKHTSLYKVPMTSKTFKSLFDPIPVNIYVLLPNGYPGKVGSAQIPLQNLLESPSGSYIENSVVIIPEKENGGDEQCMVPKRLLITGEQVLGTLSYKIRLQKPCDEMIRSLIAAPDGEGVNRTSNSKPRETGNFHTKPILQTERDHKRKTSLRRKMESYKYRHDSIHETEDEEEEQYYYQGLTSASETEELFQNNTDIILTNARNKIKESSGDGRRTSSSRPSSSKRKKEDQEQTSSRPTSSKSYQGRKTSGKMSQRPKSSKSMEQLAPKLDENLEASFENEKRKSSNSSRVRPRSAPRRDREVYQTTSSSEESDTIIEDQQSDCNGLTSSNDDQSVPPEKTKKKSATSLNEEDGNDDSMTEERYSTDSEGVVTTSYRRKKSSEHGTQGDKKDSTIGVSIGQMIISSKSLTTAYDDHSLFIEFHNLLIVDKKYLETPNSVPMPEVDEPVNFNYTQEFDVSPSRHPRRYKFFKSLMEEKGGNVDFYLTLEPPDSNTDDCKAVGFGSVNLWQMREGGSDGKFLPLDLKNSAGDIIARIQISFTIKDAINSLIS